MDLKVTLVLKESVELLDPKDKSVWRDPRDLRVSRDPEERLDPMDPPGRRES